MLDLNKEVSADEILVLVDHSYQKNKDRLTRFFSDQGFDNSESSQLTQSMKNAAFFLGTHEFDRIELEKTLRKNYRDLFKKDQQSIENLMREKNMLEDINPELDWDQILKIKYSALEKNSGLKKKAGKNVSLQIALEPLFWRLKKWGYGQTKQVNIVYDLFVEFELDDYARKPYRTKDQYIGVKAKKERIRKQFQQPAIKSFHKYAKLFGWNE